ncbi:MAG: hypothetical protein JWN64_30 [Parcubacteria group bacterium]|nr:hypothetical protein [Parcubacteria group bacterium]
MNEVSKHLFWAGILWIYVKKIGYHAPGIRLAIFKRLKLYESTARIFEYPRFGAREAFTGSF